jgi:hypothetical protein
MTFELRGATDAMDAKNEASYFDGWESALDSLEDRLVTQR